GGYTGSYSTDHLLLASWRSATGQDMNSLVKDPRFINPTGSASTFDLHVDPSSTPVEQKGIVLGSVTDDFDGEVRSALTPTDIGADAGNFIQQALPLSGDYNVGLSLFNSIAGTNIYFERTVTRVMKEVEASADIEMKNSAGDGEKKMEMKEVEEETFVPMQDGNVYTGPLHIKRSSAPNLFTDAVMGVYASINSAMNDLIASGANGPVRFLLTDATYNGEGLPITISTWTGASSVNTLTIKPAAGVTPVISGNNVISVFDLNNVRYFDLDGSNINGGTTKDLTIANTNNGAVIRLINEARNNTVKNCILKGVTNQSTNGVVFFSITTGSSGNDSNLIQNNDITRNTSSPLFGIYNFGIGVTSATKNSNNRIIGNRIFDFQSRGIFDEGNSAGNLYEGNEIYSTLSQPGFLVGFRVAGSGIEGFTFRKNYIHDLKTSAQTLVYGVELSQIQPSFIGEVSNNIISLSEVNSNDMKGLFDGSPSSNSYNIYFNTIKITGIVLNLRNSDCYHRISGTLTDFRNNILVNTRSGGTGKHYAIRTVSPVNNFNSNYNDIFKSTGTGNVFGKLDAGEITDLAGWKNVTGKDSNSISADPLFISSTDLHIITPGSSPVSNAGTTVAGITTDFDNNIRSVTTPDIGADEFGPSGNSGILDLKIIIEGFYDASSHVMSTSDTVTVYLRNTTSPYAVIDSAKSVIDAYTLTGSFTISNAPSENYYIQTQHRNTIETWSNTGISYSEGGSINYNFTTASTQAFGSNMIQVDAAPVRYAVFSGDANQDGTVDVADLVSVYNDAIVGVSGYVRTDMNGDEFVDVSDVIVTYNNSYNTISVVTP
ncbi:MAG: hypothetical protein ABI528_07200, partial [bacterium]